MICDVCGRVCNVIKMEMTRVPSIKRSYKCNNCGLGFDTVEFKRDEFGVKEKGDITNGN